MMRTTNFSSRTLPAMVLAAAGALAASQGVSGQDLCADVIQAVNHGKAGFASIKGAPGSGRYGRAGRAFDSTFDMAAVTDDCDVWADEDRPQQLRLSCHRVLRESGCDAEARRVYISLLEPLRACMARTFPHARLLEHPSTAVGRGEVQGVQFRNVADSVSGYQLDVNLSVSITKLSSTTACRVGIGVEMR